MYQKIILLFLGSYLVLSTKNVRALEGEGIVGGEDAEVGKYGYQISLEVYGRSICGGSIIDDKFVVTAAHCVIKQDGTFHSYPFTVVGGINNIRSFTSTRVRVKVEKIFIPREYDTQDYYQHIIGDIAILKLNQPLGIDSNPNLSKLNLPKKISYVGEDAIITGFGWNWVKLSIDKVTGKLNESGGGTSGNMRFAEAKIISRTDCQKNYATVLTNNHICAKVVQRSSKQSEGVCSGDSGGPLVHGGDTLIGVVSSSPIGCREKYASGIYTRVSSYLDFIKRVMSGSSEYGIRSKTLIYY